MSFGFLASSLEQRAKQGLLRKRYSVNANKDGMIQIDERFYINFASNDYLGLSQHSQVQQAFAEGIAAYGTGSGASSVVTGYTQEHQALEDDICSVLNKPAALLFSSGFSANQAICHALFNSQENQQGQILCDKYMHASFIQGALETPAKLLRYQHNNLEHAARHIAKLPENSLVASEGIFSMDGDTGSIANLADIIKREHSSHTRPWLMVDDAHAFGVIGKNGFGTLDSVKDSVKDSAQDSVNASKVDIVMATFGKAVGTGGAFVAGSQDLIDYMVNMSKHYVYSTSFSAAQARATRAALALIEQGEERNILQENISNFIRLAKQRGIPLLPSNSAIQPIIVGCPIKAVAYSQQLAKLGLWVSAIRTPTVPKNTDRLRITLSALHKEQDIHALVDALCMVIQDTQPETTFIDSTVTHS